MVAGEFALETDSHKLKNGDGSTAYTSLGYLRPINAVTVTGNHTVASNEDVINVNAASATITLPAADVIGQRVTVRKISASAGTVSTQRAGTDTIDGGTAAKALKAQFGSATFEVVASGSWSMVHRYEEGTWTPSFVPTTSGSMTISATASYALTGNIVVVGGRITVASVSSPVGLIRVDGLPYAWRSAEVAGSVYAENNFTASAGTWIQLADTGAVNGDQLYLFGWSGGSRVSDLADKVLSGANMRITATFRTDE